MKAAYQDKQVVIGSLTEVAILSFSFLPSFSKVVFGKNLLPRDKVFPLRVHPLKRVSLHRKLQEFVYHFKP